MALAVSEAGGFDVPEAVECPGESGGGILAAGEEDEGGWFGHDRSMGAVGGGREGGMITLCIRYTIDPSKVEAFEAYARALAEPIERCGGRVAGYYLPTRIAGPTNTGYGLIDFPDLATYESYRAKLLVDPGGIAALEAVQAAGCILNEERSFVRRVA